MVSPPLPPTGPKRARSERQRVARIADALRRAWGMPPRFREPALNALVRTVLSQHTSDANSDRAFEQLRRRFPRWDMVESATDAAVASAIRTAGLSNVKASRIRAMLAELHRRHGRPTLAPLARMRDVDAMEALLRLPGVGPKTAACVLLFGLGRDVFPVDTHIHRLCRRLGLVPPHATAERAQELMAGLVPRGRAHELHINLIRHGRRVCRARRPRCAECVLSPMCPSSVSTERDGVERLARGHGRRGAAYRRTSQR